ncbi:MAG: MoaD/ThiS family protein [Planctomycetes bacterium]|nr:MoaD/ThiS family protein [Planctomycetota bacterium]
MKVRVEYMGPLRTAADCSGELMEINDGSSIAELVARIAARGGADAARHLLSPDGSMIPSLLIAVNGTAAPLAAAHHDILRDGDTVLLMPPIAGG